ncbi:MAG: glycosyltransferase [Bacteroidia bacterium]|nr:glycosyltransferase [Bacteroidia bacterium]
MNWEGLLPFDGNVLPFALAYLGLSFLVFIQYFIHFLPLAIFKKNRIEESNHLPPVSVIICAKNEEDHLLEYLPKVLTQDYPEFEVVVVNDGSEDQTELVLNEYSKVFKNLKVVHFAEDHYYKHGKKMAQFVGIKSAKFEHLVFTDADCYPVSNQWLKEMAKGFTDEKEIIIGYSGYLKDKGFLNKLIRFDCFWHGVMFLSAALRKKPYMATGRNFAYKKTLFFKNKGFSNHYHLASGDDDLFLHQASANQNTNVCIHPDSLILTPARKSFASWKWQKARHISTSYYYKPIAKFRLIMFYATLYFFYGFSIFFITKFPLMWWLVAFFWLLKMLLMISLLYVPSKKLKENGIYLHSIYMEFLILVLYPYFHFLQKRFKPEQWTK